MKIYITSLLALLFSLVLNAQNLEKYEEMPEVDGVYITQNMFELLSKIDVESDDPEEQNFVELIKNLKGIKVLTTTNVEVGSQMKTDVNSYVSSENLSELMRVKKEGKFLKFYSKPGSTDQKVSQLFMFMTDEDTSEKRFVVLSIIGDIDLSEIGQMAGELKGVPGAEELKNIKDEK